MVLKTNTASATAVYPRITGRGCEERCSPNPPVRTSKMKDVDTRGVCRRGMNVWRREMFGMGRRLIKMIGKMARKAKIWCGVVKVLDYLFVSTEICNGEEDVLTRLNCAEVEIPSAYAMIRKDRMTTLTAI
jgi:hypothetical protein